MQTTNNHIGIYLRVSTDEQDEGMQLHAINEYLKSTYSCDSSFCKIYKDHGLSGTLITRPSYEQLMEDVSNGNIKIIIVYELSRLWRRSGHQALMIEELNELNIHLYSVAEGEITGSDENEMKAGLFGTINQYERKRLLRRAKRGIIEKQEKVKKGEELWNGRGPDKKKRKLRSDKGIKKGPNKRIRKKD